MKRAFEEDEISKAMEDHASNKMARPDSFSLSFTGDGWSFLKQKFYDILTKFHHRGWVNKVLDATFLTLIPKISNPAELKAH